MLGPVFDGIIDERWPAHIETVISFWLYVTRLDRSYNARNFIPAHIKHPANRADLIHNGWRFFETRPRTSARLTARSS